MNPPQAFLRGTAGLRRFLHRLHHGSLFALIASTTVGATPTRTDIGEPRKMTLPHEFSVRTLDGLTIAAEERGRKDGSAVIFVHGLAHSRASWLRQLESPLAQEFHLVAYDLRGHGLSDRPAGDAFYTEGRRWGDELAAVIEAAHLQRPVVVAWSLGGVVVLNYIRDHGDANLAGIVLVDAVTCFSPELFGEGNAGLVQPLQSPDTAIRSAATRRFIEACFVVPPKPAELNLILARAGILPASVHAAIPRISLAQGDEVLRAIRVPTLVVHGAKDGLTLPRMAQRTVSLVPRSQLSLYADAGHAPFFDESTRFNDELARLVRTVHQGAIAEP
ncbi:MAG: alpha/beta hydrolase [Opitutae bacterium]|nr:alpha/beta hydrolase [Opitutae bacterium]